MKNKILLHIIFLVYCQCAVSKIAFAQPPKVIFKCTGADQTYTVPEGITKITVKAWGAGGGEGDGFNSGGSGGFATGILTVTPGDVLTIIVGAGGCPAWTECCLRCHIFVNSSGSYGGGGARIGIIGATGGGRSAIRNASGVELITAGGGGGGLGGLYSGGGGGGLVGESNNAPGESGDPGTQTAGGNGYGVSGSGSQFIGGFSSGTIPYNPQYPDQIFVGGGSGGGGYYGGGGGKDDINLISGGAGGGGSSYVPEGGYTIGATGTLPGNIEDIDFPYPGVEDGSELDGYVVIIPNSISTNYVISPICPGQNITVNYIATGTFNAGNIFTAQLSDVNGSFAYPVNIGQTTSTVSGNIITSIPLSTTAGDHYRIRVISNDPAIWGTDNGSDITIHSGGPDICNGIDDNCDGVIDENAITATISPGGTVSICKGSSQTLTANSGPGINYQWLKNSVAISGATNQTYTASQKGGYQVSESNTFNCNSTSAKTTIKVLNSPTATITPLGSLDICQTGSVVLQANTGAGYTYQWKKGSNNISGATNQTYTATKAATYKVVVTNSSGCSKTSAGVKVTKSCREENEITDVTSAVQLSLYPNPTNGNFTIDLTTGDESITEAKVQVVNLIGQIVYNENVSPANGELKKEISLEANAAAGMYLVRVIMNDKIYSGQIIYQK